MTVRQDDSDHEFCERLKGFDKVKPLWTLKDVPKNLLDREFSQTI